MSAELLREAAALMRERAEAAEPGRWKTWGMTVMADPEGTSNVDDAICVAGAYTPSTSERRLHTGNANHIASWHPAVALAVADLLDDAAENLDLQAPGGDLGKQWDMRVHIAGDKALAVARAYLGRDA